jgi:hypothetical protein
MIGFDLQHAPQFRHFVAWTVEAAGAVRLLDHRVAYVADDGAGEALADRER